MSHIHMKRILIVDDEPDICALVKENIDHLGEVSCVTSLTEALSLCAEQCFDFIVIDKGTLRKQIDPQDFATFAKLNYCPTVISMTGGDHESNDLFKCDPVFYEKMSIKIAETIAHADIEANRH